MVEIIVVIVAAASRGSGLVAYGSVFNQAATIAGVGRREACGPSGKWRVLGEREQRQRAPQGRGPRLCSRVVFAWWRFLGFPPLIIGE